MIRHVVAFRLSAEDDVERREQVAEIKLRLEALCDVVPGVINIEVHSDLGLIATHWHAVLVADYESNDVLEAYQAHPRHLEVIRWMNQGVVTDRAVVDFEVL
jgi:hypothetical protein